MDAKIIPIFFKIHVFLLLIKISKNKKFASTSFETNKKTSGHSIFATLTKINTIKSSHTTCIEVDSLPFW